MSASEIQECMSWSVSTTKQMALDPEERLNKTQSLIKTNKKNIAHNWQHNIDLEKLNNICMNKTNKVSHTKEHYFALSFFLWKNKKDDLWHTFGQNKKSHICMKKSLQKMQFITFFTHYVNIWHFVLSISSFL